MITTLTLALALVGQEPSTKGAAQKPADERLAFMKNSLEGYVFKDRGKTCVRS